MYQILIALSLVICIKGEFDARLGVAWDKKAAPQTSRLAFHNSGGKLQCSTWNVRGEAWTSWVDLAGPTGVTLVSNPTVVHDHQNFTVLFVQADDGQVYSMRQANVGCSGFGASTWVSIAKESGSKIPFNATAMRAIVGKDTVTARRSHRNSSQIYVFTRSYSFTSRLYYTVLDGGKYTPWFSLGGSLLSDVSVVENAYSLYFEAFAVFTDKSVYHIWQHHGTTWSSWSSFGLGQPSVVPTTQPIAQSMSDNFFNGRIEVFALGTDGKIHHIWQTTCDAVPNPWGYCTWGVWYKINKPMPSAFSVVNSFSVGSNVHKGNEVLTLTKDYSVWHMWQLERGDTWSDWTKVGRPSSTVATLPKVTEYLAGWWAVHFVDAASLQVVTLTQNRSIAVSAASFPYKTNTTVAWDVPVDEATHKDWVGVYPTGGDNEKYVDYRYVQGGQNPLKDPVPKGHVTLKMYLPKGKYDVRYLVNKEFTSVMQTGVSSTASSTDPEWIQVFKGLVSGMGKEGLNITSCVQDGEKTVKTIELAVDAFENREIYKGLQLLGSALKDLYDTYIACGETDIANKIIGFINDLISCTENACEKFVIDLLKEILVLYEDVYEIFGDIRAAVNAIKILKAYEQGCMCIGRVVAACVSLPRQNAIDTAIDAKPAKPAEFDWVRGLGLKKLERL